MAGKTLDVTISEQAFTLKRPTFKEFKKVAARVAGILQLEPEIQMTVPEFDQLLAEHVEGPLAALLDGDYQDVMALWDRWLAFGEFDDFFEVRRKMQRPRLEKQQEMEAHMTAVQIAIWKNAGLLPSDFSLEKAVGLGAGLGDLTATLSSLTSTPTSTDGDETTSSKKTTGS